MKKALTQLNRIKKDTKPTTNEKVCYNCKYFEPSVGNYQIGSCMLLIREGATTTAIRRHKSTCSFFEKLNIKNEFPNYERFS